MSTCHEMPAPRVVVELFGAAAISPQRGAAHERAENARFPLQPLDDLTPVFFVARGGQ